jgi:3'(2'), 5'-bisphosphate nucleotidase
VNKGVVTGLSRSLTEEDVNYVLELVQEAGQLALEMREGVAVQEKSGPQDRVTAADFALSKLIVSRLAFRFKSDVIISEEDEVHAAGTANDRMWLVDPIDGTDNYIKNDGQYSIMIGLVQNLRPIFGWVYAPALQTLYFGGPDSGTWRMDKEKRTERLGRPSPLAIDASARIMMGGRDRRSHPWVKEHPNVTLVKAGSVGIKVANILEDKADMFVHLSGQLKVWDTAGPVSIALGGGLEVGSLEEDGLTFPLADVIHRQAIIIGRTGSLDWCRAYLKSPN